MGCLGLGGLPCSWMDRAALEMVSTRSRQIVARRQRLPVWLRVPFAVFGDCSLLM